LYTWICISKYVLNPQIEKFIDDIAERNARPQWFALITCPPSKLSYWATQTPILQKEYCSKGEPLIWCKVSQTWGAMQAPSGPSLFSDNEFAVLFYMNKDNIGKKTKKSTVDAHFPFENLPYLDQSDLFPRSSLRRSWYQCPWLPKKTVDEEGATVNLAEKPKANAELLVSGMLLLV
jgi:hypothetical protein